MIETKKVITENKNVRTTGALFATEVDALLIDVERASEFAGRKLKQRMSKMMQFSEDPEFAYLSSGIDRYLASMIIGGIKLISSTPGDKLKGYPHHDLTRFYITSDLHSAMDVLGEVQYDQRVLRKVYFAIPKEFTMMSKDEALLFSGRLHEYVKGSEIVLIQGIPHNDLGDRLAMSLSIQKDNNVEKLCTHLTDDMPDAEFMSILFPRVCDSKGKIATNARIPVTMTVGTIDELNYAVSILS